MTQAANKIMEENVEESFDERAQTRAVALGFLDKPPPRNIKVDRGLPPKRAELARFLEWERRTREEIPDLERRAAELASAVAAPKRTLEQIARLEAADLRNLKTASGPVNATLTRSAEHDALVARHREEHYTAEQAQKILRQVDLDIGSRIVGLRFLEGRRDEFLNPALLESGVGLAEAYRAKIGELREIILALWGLFSASRKYPSHQVRLPHFDFDGWVDDATTKIEADENQLEAAAAPWRAVAAEWLKNPQTNPTGVYDAAKRKVSR